MSVCTNEQILRRTAMNNSTLRDVITQALKNVKGFEYMIKENIDGNYFSAAEIALPVKNDNYEVFRIAIIKHGQKDFT